MIKGLIFDFGGTLDTQGQHWGKVLWHAYERQQIPITEQQFREAYVYAERTLGRNPIILPTYTFKKMLDVKLRLEMEYLFMKGYWKVDKNSYSKVELSILTDLYEQVLTHTAHSREVLRRLAEHYPLVLVSNFYGNMRVVLREFQLDDLFQLVVESAVVGIRKPDAGIFQLGVKALNLLPEEVMVVGDSLKNDIQPATQIGCRTAWLKGEGWTDTPVDAAGADEEIRDLAELMEILPLAGVDSSMP